MHENEQSPSILSTLLNPSVILAIAGMLTYIFAEVPLRSQRPQIFKYETVPPPPSPDGMPAARARLWEDPIEVAFQHAQAQKGTEPEKWASNLLKNLHVERLASDDSDDTENTIGEHLAKLVSQPSDQLLCLPVLVRGGPYDNDTEERKRTTYAVLSALGMSNYRAFFPDRITYVEIKSLVYNATVEEWLPVTQIVPIKLFKPFQRRNFVSSTFKEYTSVLVCWINEDQLGDHPLAAVGQILQGLFSPDCLEKKGHKITLRILGPSDSDTLVNMANEDAAHGQIQLCKNIGQFIVGRWLRQSDAIKSYCKCIGDPLEQLITGNRAVSAAVVCRRDHAEKPFFYSQHFSDPRLYSQMATIDPCSLGRNSPNSEESNLQRFASGNPTSSGLKVIRTIGTDLQLASAISDELKLRGTWPIDRQSRCNDKPAKKHVVLVTEQDTFYGRAIEAAFQKILDENSATGQHNRSLKVFTYLRGIDGRVPGDKSSDESSSFREERNSEGDGASLLQSQGVSESNAELPNGKSQFDYLRRLEDSLSAFHDEQRGKGADGITAIGVVGTDIYDKLLILRALRKKFPKATFFATDLDAALSLKSEYPTARNLVIASHFGLNLHPRLQRKAPPPFETVIRRLPTSQRFWLSIARCLPIIATSDLS
jgi:hypothetical protein